MDSKGELTLMQGREALLPQEMSCIQAQTRTGIYTLLLFFLSCQADGFRLSHNQVHQQLLLIPFTLLFCGGMLWLLLPQLRYVGKWRLLLEKSAARVGGLPAITVFLTLSSALFVYQSHYYVAAGYRLHPIATLVVFGCALAGVCSSFWVKGRSAGGYLFAAVLIAYIGVYLLSIWSFPNSVQRSDMLPLLSEAGKTLLKGHNPYRLYTFPTESVFLTYLPGTLLAFIPAVLLHIDLRFINIVYVVTLAVLIYRSAAIQYRREVASLIGIFLLSPYMLYRHEIYTQPHWLSLVACFLLLQRRRFLWAAVVFGVSAALSQFSWILFPFFLLFIFRQKGFNRAILSAAVVLLAFGVIVGPFIAWSPEAFLYGVLTHWQNNAVNARPINFSYWAAALVGAQHLELVQFLILAAIFIRCAVTRSCRTLPQCLRWMAVSFTGFIMLNILVWGYFFLLLEVILLLYLLSTNGWLQESDQLQPVSAMRVSSRS